MIKQPAEPSINIETAKIGISVNYPALMTSPKHFMKTKFQDVMRPHVMVRRIMGNLMLMYRLIVRGEISSSIFFGKFVIRAMRARVARFGLRLET